MSQSVTRPKLLVGGFAKMQDDRSDDTASRLFSARFDRHALAAAEYAHFPQAA